MHALRAPSRVPRARRRPTPISVSMSHSGCASRLSGCALPAQLASPLEVTRTVERLQGRLLLPDGVALRILECSLNCTAKHTEMPKMVDGHPRMQETCVDGELSRRLRPASLLRWDVPAVIFNAGRCTFPTQDEQAQFPSVREMTQDGYYPHGFVGHNVTSAGLGWVFRPVALRKRGGAFGHDAWTFNFRLAGTNHNAKIADRDRLDSCRSSGEMAHGSEAYAEARLASRTVARGYPAGTAQQIAASFKWAFVNTSMNCWWPPNDWERALADQRAFAMLLASRQQTLQEECSIWGSLYNQVHMSWNVSEIEGIFYVNDTLTALRGSRPKLLLEVALAASRRAYEDALVAQRRLSQRIGRVLPVVQYRVAKEECFDGRPLARRLKLANSGMKAAAAPVLFHAPGAG